MRNSILIGMAIGAVIGAVLTEGNQPVTEMVSKSKKAVKNKLDEMNNQMS